MTRAHHDGLPPLESLDEIKSPGLKAMARLGVGGTVPERTRILSRAVASLEAGDRFWPSAMASRMAGSASLDATPAHVVALACAFAARESDVARIIRATNTLQGSAYTGEVLSGLARAAPEFAARFSRGETDSDEVFLRVALANFFGTDPSSPSQMFVIDAMMRGINKVFRGGVGGFVRACLERFEEESVPDTAWGYAVVLDAARARSGYYLFEPDGSMRDMMGRIVSMLQAQMPDTDPVRIDSAIGASAYHALVELGDHGKFAALMAGLAERLGHRFLVLYARSDPGGPEGGGIVTDIMKIPAETVDEARRIASQMPEVRMHDDIRRMTEFFRQEQDLREREADA